jgi:hypothetical protein
MKGCVNLWASGEFAEMHEDVAHPRNPLRHVLEPLNASLDLWETKKRYS